MVESWICTGCSAPLAAPDDRGLSTCAHCGRVNRLGEAAPPADEAPAAEGGGGAGVAVAAIGMVVALIGGVVGVLAVVAQPEADGGAGDAVIPGLPVLPKVSLSERMLWDDVGGLPYVAQVQGKEAFLGRVRLIGNKDQLAIQATRSDDLTRLWRFEGLGTYSDGYRSTWSAVQGAVVAVSDFHGKVHLVGLDTGKEERVVTLTDKADRLCAADGAFWADQVDKRHVRVDPATGEVTDAGPKSRCPEAERLTSWEAERAMPKAPGFKPKATFPGTPLVAVGVKDPGTATPKALGFVDGRPAWESWIPAVDLATAQEVSFSIPADRRGDRLAVAYAVGSEEWRVTALDTTNGSRVWDVKLRPIFAVDSIDHVVITPTRVLVERTSSLDVLELGTGKLIGAVGDETYDK